MLRLCFKRLSLLHSRLWAPAHPKLSLVYKTNFLRHVLFYLQSAKTHELVFSMQNSRNTQSPNPNVYPAYSLESIDPTSQLNQDSSQGPHQEPSQEPTPEHEETIRKIVFDLLGPSFAREQIVGMCNLTSKYGTDIQRMLANTIVVLQSIDPTKFKGRYRIVILRQGDPSEQAQYRVSVTSDGVIVAVGPVQSNFAEAMQAMLDFSATEVARRVPRAWEGDYPPVSSGCFIGEKRQWHASPVNGSADRMETEGQ